MKTVVNRIIPVLIVHGLVFTAYGSLQYRLTLLPSVAEYAGTTLPNSINSNGIIVGRFVDRRASGYVTQGVQWTSEPQLLPKLDATMPSSPTGINDAGAIVGYDGGSTGRSRGWINVDGTLTELPGDYRCQPEAINSSGLIAGSIRDSGTRWSAVLWEGGQMRLLGSLGDSALAYDLNDAGLVAGCVYEPGEINPRAAVWKPGSLEPTLFDALPTRSMLMAVSSNGLLTGVVNYGMDGHATVLVRDGVVRVLPSVGRDIVYANDVNRDGTVVGAALNSEPDEYGDQRAIAALWHDGEAYDVNSLLVGVDLQRYRAFSLAAINDSGVIVGHVLDTQLDRRFPARFDPVSEPASVVALSLGLAALVRKRRPRPDPRS